MYLAHICSLIQQVKSIIKSISLRMRITHAPPLINFGLFFFALSRKSDFLTELVKPVTFDTILPKKARRNVYLVKKVVEQS